MVFIMDKGAYSVQRQKQEDFTGEVYEAIKRFYPRLGVMAFSYGKGIRYDRPVVAEIVIHKPGKHGKRKERSSGLPF